MPLYHVIPGVFNDQKVFAYGGDGGWGVALV